MDYSIIHIIPFDIGQSFDIYLETDLKCKKNMISSLEFFCNKKNYEIISSKISKCFFSVNLNDDISCFLLEYGVGIFIIKNIKEINTDDIMRIFNNQSCAIYFSKQKERRLILEHNLKNFEQIKEFMDKVKTLVSKVERIYSYDKNYKHGGLSYVFSIYHIMDKNNELCKENNIDIDLLMNPSIMNKIYDKKQWNSINEKLKEYTPSGYNIAKYTSNSVIASSWSAVAVIEEEKTDVIDEIVDYEIQLQSSWFLLDCLIDNIKKNSMSILELQKEKSLATNIFLDVSVILSANMSASQKNMLEKIYVTTGFEDLKNKLFLLLENRIAIEEAKISERQVKYSIITEIFLVLFTLVSIYDPLKNLVKGNISSTDSMLLGVMFLLFVICSILIIRKEK